jgi:KDO2-lipid IV(A) lauroyltransferase
MRIITDLFIWFLWYPLRSLIYHLPKKVYDALLALCSRLLYLLDSKRRNGVHEELKALYGRRFDDREIHKIVRSSFDIFVRRFFDNFGVGKIDRNLFDRIASIEGLDHVKAALNEGKGAMLIQFHFGSFALPCLGLAFHGMATNALVGKPLKVDSYFRNRMVDLRNSELKTYPFRSIVIKSSLLPIVRALKNNEVVVGVIDGRQGTNWVPVTLFERTALFSPGLVDLAMRTGAPILPMTVVRGPDGRHRIIIEPHMELVNGGERGEAVKANTERFIRNYEKYLLDYPDHFAMTLYSISEEARQGLHIPLFRD